MVIDTSALVAILKWEAEARAFLEAIEAAASVSMSVATYVECSIVLESRFGWAGLLSLDQFLTRARIHLIPVDIEQAQRARIAFSRFGKGRHRASLNLGDCFSYAAAAALGEPLLAKGDDFVHTDAALVQWPESSR